MVCLGFVMFCRLLVLLFVVLWLLCLLCLGLLCCWVLSEVWLQGMFVCWCLCVDGCGWWFVGWWLSHTFGVMCYYVDVFWFVGGLGGFVGFVLFCC